MLGGRGGGFCDEDNFKNKIFKSTAQIVLTYKSMTDLTDIIKNSLGLLVHRWEPKAPDAHPRVLFMADELYQRVSNPAPQDYRIGQLWSDFDRFCSGRLITVGYGKEGTCFMKLLDERSDQIWEMRSKDPQPQIRVFGRFVGIDQFLATHASFRGDLGYPSKSKFEGNNWPAEIARCKTIWNQVCHNSPPHEGDSINDYISSNVVEVGKLH